MTFKIHYTMFKDDTKDHILLDGMSMLFQTNIDREKRHYDIGDKSFDASTLAYMSMDAQKRMSELNKMIKLVNKEDLLDEVQPRHPRQIKKEMIHMFEQQIDKLNEFYEHCKKLGAKITLIEIWLNEKEK